MKCCSESRYFVKLLSPVEQLHLYHFTISNQANFILLTTEQKTIAKYSQGNDSLFKMALVNIKISSKMIFSITLGLEADR